MKNNLEKIADTILKERYLEDTPYLLDEELAEVLNFVVEKSNEHGWRLVQHVNVELQEIWHELDLQDGFSEDSYETLEWLNYTR